MKKNICFFIANIDFSGGTERVCITLSNLLVNRGYNVFILSAFGESQPFFEIDKKIHIVSIYKEKKSLYRSFFGYTQKLRDFIKKNNIGTLVTIEPRLTLISIPALFSLKINNICWEHFSFVNNEKNKLRFLAKQLAAIFCDKIVILSKSDMNLWQKNTLLRAKIYQIYNPSQITKTEHIPSLTNKIVLSVGRLVYVKGYDLLIKAWAQAIKKISADWKLYIVGDGEQQCELQELINKLNVSESVFLLGKTNDVVSYYKKASFYCLSSRNEGFPTVLLEAQAFNLPIISFDCQTGPSEIVKDGYTGILVKDGDTDELAANIVDLSLNQVKYDLFVNNLLSETNAELNINIITEKWESIL